MDATRVVITGMGIYSTIGKNIDAVKNSLYKGKSGIGLDLARKRDYGFRSTLEKNIDHFLSNSFGFDGTNSSLIISKFKK